MMRLALSVSSCHAHTPPPGPPGEASARLEPPRNHHHHRCCCLLLQHCTDATRSGPAIFIVDSCTENLNCYEEKHTLMIFFLHSFIYYCSYEVICLTSCHLKVNSNVAIVKNDCMNKIFYKRQMYTETED